jgi:hypothetical protein
MKKLIPFFLILIGCGNDDVVTIPKEEYNRLKGDTIKPEYPKPFKLYGSKTINLRIVLGSDGHEYIEIDWYSQSYNVLHSPECVKCKRIDTIIHTNSVTNQ